MSTTVKKLRYNDGSTEGLPVQVESAVRDGTGKIISTDCVRHAEFEIDTDDATTSVSFSALALGNASDGSTATARIPRIIQVFDHNGNEVGVDAKIDLIGEKIDITLTGAPADKKWTARVTAW